MIQTKTKNKTIKKKTCSYCKLKLPKDDFNLKKKICILCEKHKQKQSIKELLTVHFD
jgi:hypothetical protein